MRVIVEDDAFDGRISRGELHHLMNFAWERRHRILVQRGPCFQRWFASFSAEAREPFEAALDFSQEIETREPARAENEIRIGASAGCMPIDKALERLGRAFLLFLENDRSDRAFLESVASPPHRQRLQIMRTKGWIEFRSRSGISDIKKLIADELNEFPGDAGRMFAIFDSESEDPEKPHKDASDLTTYCEQTRVLHRRLARRAIENYLTRPALVVWADANETKADTLRGRIETLHGEWFRARPARRHHFHMKKGFSGMSLNHEMYSDLPERVKKSLREGLGSDVSKAFTSDQPREVDLRADGSWDELGPMIEALVESMR